MNAISMRCLAVRLFIPVSWRISRRRIAASLRRFSEVEADSAWQMLVALDNVTDPEFRVVLFNNALEEVHHSYIFRGIARQYEDQLASEPTEERHQLFDPRQGLVKFEACHFVGEADVFRDFLAYASASPHADIRQTFMAIRGDEEEHQRLAYAELVRQCGSVAGARRLIWKVRLRRAWEGWVRGCKKFGDCLSFLLLMGIYFSLGTLLAPACRARLRSNGAAERRPVAADEQRSAEPVTS